MLKLSINNQYNTWNSNSIDVFRLNEWKWHIFRFKYTPFYTHSMLCVRFFLHTVFNLFSVRWGEKNTQIHIHTIHTYIQSVWSLRYASFIQNSCLKSRSWPLVINWRTITCINKILHIHHSSVGICINIKWLQNTRFLLFSSLLILQIIFFFSPHSVFLYLFLSYDNFKNVQRFQNVHKISLSAVLYVFFFCFFIRIGFSILVVNFFRCVRAFT